MSTAERVMATLLLHDILAEANAVGHDLARKQVKVLREQSVLDEFVHEWVIAKLAWIDEQAHSITNEILRKELEGAVHIHGGVDTSTYVDYRILAQNYDDAEELGQPRTPGSIFLRGFGKREALLPKKPGFFSRKPLTPTQQIEVMLAVNGLCWQLPHALEETLEHYRPRVTDELISVV